MQVSHLTQGTSILAPTAPCIAKYGTDLKATRGINTRTFGGLTKFGGASMRVKSAYRPEQDKTRQEDSTIPASLAD